MKKITCEMCGSSDMLKQDGVFVCQTCGTKYSIEEAKKMMVEVDGTVEVTGTVAIDNANQINSYYDLAEKYLETDINKAEEYCDKILEVDSKNYRGWLLKFKFEHYKCNEIFNDDSTGIYDNEVSRRLKEKDIWGKNKYEDLTEEIELQFKKANQYLGTAISLSNIKEKETIINEVYDIVSLYSETLFKMIQLHKGLIYKTINYFFNCPYKILLEFVVENYNEDETIVFVRRYIDLIKNHIELLFNQSIKSESLITAIYSLEALMFLIKSKSEYVDLKKYNVDIEEWLNLYRQLRVSKTIIHCISEMESSKLELETTEDDEMFEWRMYDDETAYKIFNRNKKWLSYLNRKYIEQDIPTELRNKIEEYLNVTLPTLSNSSVELISSTHKVYHTNQKDTTNKNNELIKQISPTHKVYHTENNTNRKEEISVLIKKLERQIETDSYNIEHQKTLKPKYIKGLFIGIILMVVSLFAIACGSENDIVIIIGSLLIPVGLMTSLICGIYIPITSKRISDSNSNINKLKPELERLQHVNH